MRRRTHSLVRRCLSPSMGRENQRDQSTRPNHRFFGRHLVLPKECDRRPLFRPQSQWPLRRNIFRIDLPVQFKEASVYNHGHSGLRGSWLVESPAHGAIDFSYFSPGQNRGSRLARGEAPTAFPCATRNLRGPAAAPCRLFTWEILEDPVPTRKKWMELPSPSHPIFVLT